MEKVLIQGKGENQYRISLNVPDDVDRMMQTILKEGTEDWTDRDLGGSKVHWGENRENTKT